MKTITTDLPPKISMSYRSGPCDGPRWQGALYSNSQQFKEVNNKREEYKLLQLRANVAYYNIKIPTKAQLAAIYFVMGFNHTRIAEMLMISRKRVTTYLNIIQGNVSNYYRRNNAGKSWYEPFCSDNPPNLFVHITIPKPTPKKRKDSRNDDLYMAEEMLYKGYSLIEIGKICKQKRDCNLEKIIRSKIYPKIIKKIIDLNININEPEKYPKRSTAHKKSIQSIYKKIKSEIGISYSIFTKIRICMIRGTYDKNMEIKLRTEESKKKAVKILCSGKGTVECRRIIGSAEWKRVRNDVYCILGKKLLKRGVRLYCNKRQYKYKKNGRTYIQNVPVDQKAYRESARQSKAIIGINSAVFGSVCSCCHEHLKDLVTKDYKDLATKDYKNKNE